MSLLFLLRSVENAVDISLNLDAVLCILKHYGNLQADSWFLTTMKISTCRQLILSLQSNNSKLGPYPTDSGRQWVGVVSKAHLRSQAVKR